MDLRVGCKQRRLGGFSASNVMNLAACVGTLEFASTPTRNETLPDRFATVSKGA
jgi:hypothetical protein